MARTRIGGGSGTLEIDTPPTTTAGTRVSLAEGVAAPLFEVDMAFAPDHSFGCRVQFAVEVTDGNDVQLREGDVNAALVEKGGVFTTAQAVNGTNAVTLFGSTLTTTFGWDLSGPKPVFTVTIVSSLVLTESHINFFIPFSSHPLAITIL